MTNEEAIEVLKEIQGNIVVRAFSNDVEALDMAIEALEAQRVGHWLSQDDTSKHHYGWYQCSECGAYIGTMTNYCSECGSYNGGEE